jgi:hypothetical protein
MGDMCTASGFKETAHSRHLSVSVTYLIVTSETSTAVGMAMTTATQHKHHFKAAQSHADLNICINPPLRRHAQTHVLEFNCFPLSHFHSEIPQMDTFQT